MTCRDCKGTGLCSWCEGLGDTLDRAGRYVQCTICHGRQVCPRCDGHGDAPDELDDERGAS